MLKPIELTAEIFSAFKKTLGQNNLASIERSAFTVLYWNKACSCIREEKIISQ